MIMSSSMNNNNMLQIQRSAMILLAMSTSETDRHIGEGDATELTSKSHVFRPGDDHRCHGMCGCVADYASMAEKACERTSLCVINKRGVGHSRRLRRRATSKLHYYAWILLKMSDQPSSKHWGMTTRRIHGSRRNSKDYCHVYKSSKPSSKRTRAACAASDEKYREGSRQAKIDRKKKMNKKLKRMNEQFVNIRCPSDPRKIEDKYYSKNIVYFDGGSNSARQDCLPKGPKPSWALPVLDSSMTVVDCRPHQGIVSWIKRGCPAFIRIPRVEALRIAEMDDMTNSNRMCTALQGAIDATAASNMRGQGKRNLSKYKTACLGVQLNRASPGLRQYTYHKDKMNPQDWDYIVSYIVKCEKAYERYVPTDIVSHTQEARRVVEYNLILPTSGEKGKGTRIFPGINISLDACLPCHTDNDFTLSVVSIHSKGVCYKSDDTVRAYFCFPTLKMAVPLRLGDLLVFNALVPHCISSKCNAGDNLYSISLYLKTGVVGLNDNSKNLTMELCRLIREETYC